MDGALLGAAIGAVFGGLAAALVSANASRQTDRRAVREKARLALWAYHRALAGFAVVQLSRAGYGEEQIHLTTADITELRSAHEAAYPWASFLPVELRSRLIRDIAIDSPWYVIEHESADTIGTHAQELSVELEAALEQLFPVGSASWISRAQASWSALRRQKSSR